MGKERTNAFGEVFTPPQLVYKMLKSIPTGFWLNPDIKIIDNSCGEGVFIKAIYDILIEHHPREHILDNMLYGCDIQQDNVNKTKEIGIKHLECVDALTFDYWGNTQFDLVVGNPPYNKRKGDKKGNNCNPLWISFTELAVTKLVKNDGYLLYVHPPLYRKIGHKLWPILNEKHFVEIHMFNMEKSSKIFNCATKVDWYLWKNGEKTFSRIYDELNKNDELNKSHLIDLADKKFIPNHTAVSVYFIFSGGSDIIYNCNYHHYTHELLEEQCDAAPYPCVYLINKKGVEFRWSSYNNRGHFGVPKVIVSMGTGKAILDWEGKYGMCEITFGIPIKTKEEGEKLLRFLDSDYFKDILDAIKWKTVQIDYKIFKYLNKNNYI